VASRAGAAELVVENGVTGVLTPPGDVDALVAALEPLMRDPASAIAMGIRAQSRVLAKFSLDTEAAGSRKSIAVSLFHPPSPDGQGEGRLRGARLH